MRFGAIIVSSIVWWLQTPYNHTFSVSPYCCCYCCHSSTCSNYSIFIRFFVCLRSTISHFFPSHARHSFDNPDNYISCLRLLDLHQSRPIFVSIFDRVIIISSAISHFSDRRLIIIGVDVSCPRWQLTILECFFYIRLCWWNEWNEPSGLFLKSKKIIIHVWGEDTGEENGKGNCCLTTYILIEPMLFNCSHSFDFWQEIIVEKKDVYNFINSIFFQFCLFFFFCDCLVPLFRWWCAVALNY